MSIWRRKPIEEQWVEHGIAPKQIVASHVVNGTTTFTRPLCPYPAFPPYSGTGDPTDSASFVCVENDNPPSDDQPPAPKYLNDRHNYPVIPDYRDSSPSAWR